MNPLAKVAIFLAITLALCVAVWLPLRGVLQFRAVYPGGFTFIGHADGLLGTQYHRVFLWRSPEDTAPLPAVTVQVRGTPYRLSELTSELMQSLGGVAGKGGVKDAAACYLNYRFENERLTFFALDSPREAIPPASGNPQADRFHLQMGDGPPFLLPVTRAQLIALAGRPAKESGYIAN